MKASPASLPWSVVLAGGEGSRLRSFTEGWLGRHVPKQYCAFTGGRTLIESALDRASKLSGPTRTVTVTACHHAVHSEPIFSDGSKGQRILQPRNCDTAPGIYLALTYVRNADPDATVVILPSDHFLRPEERFLAAMRAGAEAARRLRDQIVLLGVVPDSPEPDYGWMTPGRELEPGGEFPLRAVDEFVEKPHEAKARALMASGALWNTFVMAARVETLWSLGHEHAGAIMPLFERLQQAIGTPSETDTLEAIYEEMPEQNFSSCILQNAKGRVCVMEVDGVAWSDWGRADRIASTIVRFGVGAGTFPLETALQAKDASGLTLDMAS
jgi:mannose-1-phosphate guanylyltransferase